MFKQSLRSIYALAISLLVSNDFPLQIVAFYVHSFAGTPKRSHYISGIWVKGVKHRQNFKSALLCAILICGALKRLLHQHENQLHIAQRHDLG
jgi:hypothetical protein